MTDAEQVLYDILARQMAGGGFDQPEIEFIMAVVGENGLLDAQSAPSIEELAGLMNELGSAWRHDWSDFDGRTLRDQMKELGDVARGTKTVAQYRSEWSLCLAGCGHWDAECGESCKWAPADG